MTELMSFTMTTFSPEMMRTRTTRTPTTTTSTYSYFHPRWWKWTCRIIILILLTTPQSCNSDFNVILPEICNHPGLLNLTWIRSMVLLGIREEQTQPALNIFSPEEICDGSDGLLKFISLAQVDPNAKMISSLKQPLCPTAATFSHLNKRQFISWTCSKMSGVQSLKPSVQDVILAIQRMLNFSQWSTIALTKSRFDRSPFCDEVGAYLQNNIKNNSNTSVMILGNYEDLDHYESMSFTHNFDGLFLCISYDYGFTHNLSLKTGEFKPGTMRGFGQSGNGLGGGRGGIPTVLLLQWPLPVELFSPGNPTLAVVADTHPRMPTTSSFDFQQRNWDPLETSSENILPHKLLETLLAQMILKSVKMSLELDRKEIEQELTTSSESSPSSTSGGIPGAISSPSSSSSSSSTKYSNHNFHHFPRHYNGKGAQLSSQQQDHQFLFSLLQFEKDRWHPLINLVNGEKHFNAKGPSGVNRRSFNMRKEGSNNDSHEIKIDEDYLMTWLQVILVMVTTGFVALLVVIGAIYARKKARKRDFSSAKHCRKLSRRHRVPGTCKLILTPHDLTFGPFVPENPKKQSKSPFIGSLPSFQRSSQDKPDLLKGSFSIGTTLSLRKQSSQTATNNHLKNEAGILTGSAAAENTARYKGELVYLKRLQLVSSDSFEVKQKAMLVLETIHGLRHENLVTMIGCFIGNTTGPPPPALVYEFCSRGSLHDIIKQSDIKLDWAFKLSLLTDLVRGMRYLHSSMVRVHGFLTSHNCVIDARWVLKITDYGLPAFNYTEGLPLPPRSAKELLWTAPELLRDEGLRQQGTQAGDVFSFAIIMQEILVRGEPYCMLTLTAEEILEKVKKPPPLIRPSVSKGAAPPEAINIMRQCWAELPDMRPDFMVIHDLFKTLNHGRKANIVDTMFQMLEKYSNNLEELIRERTEQLDLEKKKTEQLLNRMLPSTVAEKLKLGLPVDPEEFSDVTIYFSDIVGFTTISAYSTPFEVVDLLNDLYTCFDATINDYNVYKVETIGDGYMVVGGAPLWSHDHADQIATMALDLLHQSGKFRIRHLPYTPLRLRIGLHTGSCCAGVVGLTMPRYCLFGDTVNTASRMESTGMPWRIHLSGETKAKLDEAGGYIIENRGMTDIKGKGPMPTYWLLGKEGFDKELPTPPGLDLDENAIKYGRTGVWPTEPCNNKTVPVHPAITGNNLNAKSPMPTVIVQDQGSTSTTTNFNNSNTTPTNVVASGGFTTSGAVKVPNISGESTRIPSFGECFSQSCTSTNSTTTTTTTTNVVSTVSPNSPNHLAPPKSSSSFAVVPGETMRSLSPAEQIAHNLLNGRPTTKGLRRQLSLDHRAMPILLKQVQKLTLRRAPSLEENLEQSSSSTPTSATTTTTTTYTTITSSLSSTKGNDNHNEGMGPSLSHNAKINTDVVNLTPSNMAYEPKNTSSHTFSHLNNANSFMSNSNAKTTTGSNMSSSSSVSICNETVVPSKDKKHGFGSYMHHHVHGGTGESAGESSLPSSSISSSITSPKNASRVATLDMNACTKESVETRNPSPHPNTITDTHVTISTPPTIPTKADLSSKTNVHPPNHSSSRGSSNSNKNSNKSDGQYHHQQDSKIGSKKQLQQGRQINGERVSLTSPSLLESSQSPGSDVIATSTVTSTTTGPESVQAVHSGSKINDVNYVVVDSTAVKNVPVGLTVSPTTGFTLTSNNMNSSIINSSHPIDYETIGESTGGTTGPNTSTTTTAVTSKLRLSTSTNSRVAAKLAKILSVVEENDSPTMERKYEIVTNQV